MRLFLRPVLASGCLLLLAAIVGCSGAKPDTDPLRDPIAVPPAPPIVAGIAPVIPPLAFKRDGRLAGLEIDLATEVARDIRRPIRFVEYPLEDLIPALVSGKIDVIMSGMTQTRLREVRVAFGVPYLESGLVALVRRDQKKKFATPQAVVSSRARIGVARTSTAERYAREQHTDGQVSALPTPGEAVAELTQGRVDAVLGDAPTIAWAASENEATLAPLFKPFLTRDSLAWGFRPGDEVLRSEINGALSRLRSSGVLQSVVDRWLPDWGATFADGAATEIPSVELPRQPNRRIRR